MTNFNTAIEQRRSVYNLKTSSTITDDKIQEIIAHALKHTPSAFNSQTGRIILLLDGSHNDLWEITRSALKVIVPETSFAESSGKMDMFKNAHGTVLFFEDQDTVKGLQEKFPLYSHNFPIWSNQSSGMLQFNVWTSLAIEGLGASLQHYNELIEEAVKEKWSIDASWKLLAQMPFGEIAVQADEKEFAPLDHRFKVYK